MHSNPAPRPPPRALRYPLGLAGTDTCTNPGTHSAVVVALSASSAFSALATAAGLDLNRFVVGRMGAAQRLASPAHAPVR